MEFFYIFNSLLTCTITVKIHQASSNLKKHVVGGSGIRGVSFQVRNVVLSSPDRKPWDSKQKTYFLAFSCWDKRMVVYQPLTTKKATIRINPMVMTSRTARGHEGWGDIPAPTVLIMSPSKLQCTLNCPAFIPHRAFLATANASIDFDDPEIFFVSSGLVFSSANTPPLLSKKRNQPSLWFYIYLSGPQKTWSHSATSARQIISSWWKLNLQFYFHENSKRKLTFSKTWSISVRRIYKG